VRDTVPILLIGILLASVLLFYLPSDGIWAGDQGAKYVQVESLIRQSFRETTLLYPGADLDPSGTFSPLPALYTVPARDGAVSIYSYPYAFLCAGFVKLAGLTGLLLPSVVATLLLLFFCVRVGRRLGLRTASSALPWVLAGGTPILFYALSFWEHAPAAAVAAGALALGVEAMRRESVPLAGAAGLVAALSFLVRPEGLFVGAAASVAMAAAPRRRARLVAAALAGWALGLLPAAGLNMALYGQPLGGGAALNFGGLSVPLVAGKLLAARGQIAASIAFDRNLYWKYFAALVVLAIAVRLTTGRWRTAALLALALAALRLWFMEGGMFLKTGLVAACPLVLLALAARRRASPVRAILDFLLAFCGVYFLAVVLTAPNDGGAQWGPRYLLPMLAPAAVVAWHQAEHLFLSARGAQRRAVGAALALLLLLSGALQFHSVRVLEHSLSRGKTIHAAVRAAGDDVVLADFWWVSQLLAPLYFERRLFMLHQPGKLDAFIAELAAHGQRGFVFVVSRSATPDLDRLRAAGAACRAAAEFAGPLFVLDCRVTTALPAPAEEAADPLQQPPAARGLDGPEVGAGRGELAAQERDVGIR